MALTREYLSDLGVTEEQADKIVKEHQKTLHDIKDERDRYKTRAEGYEALKTERDKLQQQVDDAAKGTDWKAEYDKLKADTEAKETRSKVKTAFRALLKAEKVDERDHDLILAGTDFSTMKLDKDGKLTNADKLSETIREKYADRIVTEGKRAAPTRTPPEGNKTRRTREEIYAVDEKGRYKLSTEERQQAIMENPEAFGR